jgi:hypothetical protein
LTRQLAAKRVKNAKAVARALLKKRGHVTEDGELTKAGKKRQDLGNAGRAKDRQAKYSGRDADDFKYNPRTNRATVKKEK